MSRTIFRKSTRSNFDLFIYESLGELDRVKVALTFFFRSSNPNLFKIEFYSSLLGIAGYYLETNTFEAKVWEGEDIAQSLSNLNHHYTGEFLFSSSEGEIIKKIIFFVLNEVNNQSLKELIEKKLFNTNLDILGRGYFETLISNV